MKILFVHEVSYLKKPVYEMHEFPELLARKGHEVTFFDFDEGRKFWQSSSSGAKGRMASGRVLEEIRIQIERPIQLGLPGFDRLFVILSSIPTLWRILRNQRFDVIVLYAVPTYGLQTVLLARKFGTPLVFRALDVSHKIRSSFLSPIIKLVEKFVYSNATAISANNPAMNDYCRSLTCKVVPSHINFPPLDVRHFEKKSKDSEVMAKLGISPTDKVVTYMGTFFYFSGLREALTQFAKRSKDLQTIKFLLIGGGEQSNELQELARKLGVEDKVIFTGFVTYADLPKYLGISNVAINPLVQSLVTDAAFPNKVLQYLASGLHVVSTPLRGLSMVFSDSENISWGRTAELVMDAALDYLLELDAGSKNSKGDAALENLDRFLPDEALESFEKTLLSLKKERA
jgi:glycosyltransferase involved in cell wall biosynthesis